MGCDSSEVYNPKNDRAGSTVCAHLNDPLDCEICHVRPLKIEESDNVPCNASEDGMEPYFVEVDNNGYSKCSAGRTWVVIDPNGIAGGISYGLEEEAIEIADMLNEAYAHGKGK